MRQRVEELLRAPGHFEFYRENGFGAIIGSSDFMAVVIVDETAVHTLSNALKKTENSVTELPIEDREHQTMRECCSLL